MWGRVLEMALGVWLGLSPFIFQAQTQNSLMWGDFGLALLIFLFAGLSYWPPTRHAHVMNLAVAMGLCVWGRFSMGTPPPPEHQNHIVIGLLLLMFAIIPNDASDPPEAWRRRVDQGTLAEDAS